MSDIDELFEFVPILDRSTAERYANCPAQGWLTDHVSVFANSPAMDAGNAVHEAIASVTRAIADGDVMKLDEARAMLDQEIAASRPDIQPDAIQGIKYSAYAILQKLLYLPDGQPRHPADIVVHDGGTETRSGQLAHDLDVDGSIIRITCEVDLLLATESPGQLEMIDYKSGRGEWTVTGVASSFQLGCWYPVVVMMNYPIERLAVRVWNTRTNDLLPGVIIERKRIPDMIERIKSAARIWKQHHADKEVKTVPAWPGFEKCSNCSGAFLCPSARSPVKDVAEDPSAALGQYVALTMALNQLGDALSAHVKQTHESITLPDGTTYGLKPPAKPRLSYGLIEP